MRKILFLTFSFAFILTQAQAPQKLNSAEIHQAIKKLNFLGSVLYVAAHPDDENTRLISYFANEVHARTGYLSITRGDGGQNLIGPELKELLGVIRTQELLAARRIDGGEQLFTRAIDFGYTKTPQEAMEFWNNEDVLSDVVWAIRKFKPDVIINRFDHRTAGETHGQHTASAILSLEAFELAGDKTKFKDHLEFTSTFTPKKIFFNTSPWFYQDEEEFQKIADSLFIKFDTGVYFPLLGLSNPEIASLSRSQHQSQGFGSMGSRGIQMEYLELLKGKNTASSNDIFSGIDTSWNRIKGGEEIGRILYEVEKNYNFEDPSASISELVRAYDLIQQLEDEHWKNIKTQELKEIIAAAAGLYLEAAARTPDATPLEEILINLEAVNRSPGEMKLVKVEMKPDRNGPSPQLMLKNNETWKESITYQVPGDMDYTTPYWLKEKGSIGKYKVDNRQKIGLPENPPELVVKFFVEINNTIIPFEKPVIYKYTDPVEGEVYQPFEIIPQASAKIHDKVLIFPNGEEKTVVVTVYAGKNNISGELRLNVSEDWKVEPASFPFTIKEKGAGMNFSFTISPPANQSESDLQPEISIDNNIYNSELIILNYKHIPRQTLVLPSSSKVVKLDIKKKGNNIAFIEGAGDVVPESMEQIGYNVTRIDPENISQQYLGQFDAVILGIRAYNTVGALRYRQPALLEYVKAGGTVIVQYNTNRGLLVNSIAPYELQLSRDRVTEEDAEVRFLAPNHPVLNTPNKIDPKDFENWVQERGLYFADEWAKEFIPILSINDNGEEPKNGGLMVAPYGKGHFVYTGLSFFRQFPEGVPGAFRLFANIVSLGKE